MARMLLENIVNTSGRYELALSVPSARQAVQICMERKVDLVLMDIVMGDGYHGLEASEEIKRVSPCTRIIIMTSMPESSYLKRAQEIGVESFWYKEVQEQPILALMDRTMAGESVYPDNPPRLLLGNADSLDFSERELDVLREMTTGATNGEIAERLGIAENTVKVHIRHMLEKTGYANRTVLAVQARVLGIAIGE